MKIQYDEGTRTFRNADTGKAIGNVVSTGGETLDQIHERGRLMAERFNAGEDAAAAPPTLQKVSAAVRRHEATVEALSRAVCKAWGLNPDGLCSDHPVGPLIPCWTLRRVRDTVTAYIAMRAVGATLPWSEEPNRG